MKKVSLFIFILLLGTLIACSNEKEDPTVEEDVDEEILAIEVDLTVTEAVEVSEIVSMKALVTMGDEKIDDADNVVFEIWEEGNKDSSEMIESVNEEDGIYTAETSFDTDGLFHIQVHVDARGQHTMPKKEVTVGTGGNDKKELGTDDHGTGVSMQLMNHQAIKATEEIELTTYLELDGKALENVDLRYEIWEIGNEEKHDWVDSEEAEPGVYKTQYVFAKAGTYHVEVHVKDEHDLHEHQSNELIVK